MQGRHLRRQSQRRVSAEAAVQQTFWTGPAAEIRRQPADDTGAGDGHRIDHPCQLQRMGGFRAGLEPMPTVQRRRQGVGVQGVEQGHVIPAHDPADETPGHALQLRRHDDGIAGDAQNRLVPDPEPLWELAHECGAPRSVLRQPADGKVRRPRRIGGQPAPASGRAHGPVHCAVQGIDDGSVGGREGAKIQRHDGPANSRAPTSQPKLLI